MQPQNNTAIVADDHELFRTALSAMLRRDLGFNDVREVGSLDHAVDLLGQTNDARLVSIDLAMPGMNSGASLQAIREAFPDIHVVVVTGSTSREDILLALSAGVHGYVPKTFRINEIARAFRQILDGNIFVPPCISTMPAMPAADLAKGGPTQARPDELTPRQFEVLRLLADGKSNKEIARALHLADGTVKVHVSALFRALGVRNRGSAVAAFAQLSRGYRS